MVIGEIRAIVEVQLKSGDSSESGVVFKTELYSTRVKSSRLEFMLW
jgi:hypothetical protein